MAAIFVAHGVSFGAWAGCVPRFRDLWQLGDGPLGLVLLALGLGALSAMPLGRWLATRHGGARVALVAGTALAATIVGPSALRALGLPASLGWVALLASGGVMGLAAGVTDIAMNAEASALEKRSDRPIMSRLHGGWSAGGFVGGGVAALGAALAWSVPTTMLAAGAIVVALLAAAGSVLWRDSVPETQAEMAASPRPRLRTLAVLGVMAAICFEMEGAMADWAGVFLHDARAAPPALASSAYSGVALAMMLSRFGGDAVRRLTGPVAMTRAGGALAAGAMAMALLSSWLPAAIIGFASVGFGVANIVPVVFSAAGLRGGAGAIAVVASVGYAGLLIGPPVIGFAAQALTLPVALWLIVGGGIALAALAGAVRPRSFASR